MALCRSLGRWHEDLNRVRFRPDGSAVCDVETVHNYLHTAAIDGDPQIVIVHLVALERVILGAWNWVSMRSATASHEIDDASMLMSFVVMHVS